MQIDLTSSLDGLAALWPIEMWVDYIRVYQDPKKHNIGCDPVDYPTQEYIKLLGPAYTNPNIVSPFAGMISDPLDNIQPDYRQCAQPIVAQEQPYRQVLGKDNPQSS